MFNIVEQIENRYITEFQNDAITQLYYSIPQKIRQNILIRKLNCKPYGNRKTIIRWGSPDVKSMHFVSMSNISADSVELTVLPTPAPTDENARWYTKENLQVHISNEAILKKLVFYKKNDGSRIRLRFKHLSWQEAEEILQPIILWTRKNQNETRAKVAPHTNGIGLAEYEMVALVLKTLGGTAEEATICQKYADLFGFTLTDEIADGVRVALHQHDAASSQYIGFKNLFQKDANGNWSIRA